MVYTIWLPIIFLHTMKPFRIGQRVSINYPNQPVYYGHIKHVNDISCDVFVEGMEHYLTFNNSVLKPEKNVIQIVKKLDE